MSRHSLASVSHLCGIVFSCLLGDCSHKQVIHCLLGRATLARLSHTEAPPGLSSSSTTSRVARYPLYPGLQTSCHLGIHSPPSSPMKQPPLKCHGITLPSLSARGFSSGSKLSKLTHSTSSPTRTATILHRTRQDCRLLHRTRHSHHGWHRTRNGTRHVEPHAGQHIQTHEHSPVRSSGATLRHLVSRHHAADACTMLGVIVHVRDERLVR